MKEEKDISNKEVMDRLEAYFLAKSSPQKTARALGALMVDMNRLMVFSELPKFERDNLYARMVLNSKELENFIEDPSASEQEFNYIVFNSRKEE